MVGSGCVTLQLPLPQDLVDRLLLLRERHDDVMLTAEVHLKGFVTFFLQVAVVILLRWERHAVQRVMGVKPLLLFQSQALQLS